MRSFFLTCAIAGAAAALGAFGYIALIPRLAPRLVEYRQTRCPTAEFRCAPAGVFAHQRPTEFAGDAIDPYPNVDSLLSSAWIDLSGGPYLLQIPDMETRAYAFEFADADFKRIAGLGFEAFGAKGGEIFIAGPGWSGVVPGTALLLRAPTQKVYVTGRISVLDALDVKKANALQDEIHLRKYNSSN